MGNEVDGSLVPEDCGCAEMHPKLACFFLHRLRINNMSSRD